jgi:cytochrome c553
MKNLKVYLFFLTLIVLISCSKQFYSTNGEAIYETGKNLKGDKLLDKSASRIKIVNSCTTCHGKKGDRMNSVSIQFSYLSNPENFSMPYNDSLFFVFSTMT